MAEATQIGWTDATINFWWGCTKVGPGCINCYAETWSRRTGERIWGMGAARRKIKTTHSILARIPAGSWVFMHSMSDLFDNEVPLEWFEEAWEAIESRPDLRFQLVTKRVSIVQKRLAAIGRTSWPQHAGLIITVCDHTEFRRDVPRLTSLKWIMSIPWVGLSVEPMLGLIGVPYSAFTGLDWVIAGGESGPAARPIRSLWVRWLRDACSRACIPFFFKQWGDWLPEGQLDAGVFAWAPGDDGRVHWWFPEPPEGAPLQTDHCSIRIGKKKAGNLLDGRIHMEMPRIGAETAVAHG